MAGIFSDPTALLPGLLPAAWRGRLFWVPDVRHTVGRRVVAQLYPGLDLKTHEDLGGFDGPIRLSGLVIGDDYVAQARALELAFRQAGPGTLLHPWRGEITCVLLRPAEISYASDELRVARIEAEFDPTSGAGPALISTLSGLISAALALSGAGASLMRGVLGAVPMALAIWSLGTGAAANALAIAATAAAGARASALLVPAVATASEQASAALALSPRSVAAASLSTAVTGLASLMGDAYRAAPVPAIGAGGVPPSAVVPPDPRLGASLLLGVASTLGAQARLHLADTSVYVAAEVAFVGEAVRIGSAIAFESRQDAEAWRLRLDAALAAAGARVAALAPALPAPAATLWRAIGATRTALGRDMNEIVGRLPSVTVVTAPATVSAFLLAQHLAGNTPASVVRTVDDIVRRNRLRHPARVQAGPVEVLL